MLPSRYKVLLDAARAGDFRSIARLISPDDTQSDQEAEQKETEQKKPLSSVRQLDEFYRNSSRNGFRGEEVDLSVKESFLRTLLDRGVDPKESADVEGTALHQAAEDGSLEIVKVLVTNPEDTDYVNFRRHKCWSPLHLAAREGHVDVVEFLMANGADAATLNGSEDTRQDTVLQIAAWKGNPSVVKTLLAKKATSVSDKGRFGGPMRAAVLSASRLYNEEICRIEQNEQSKLPQASLEEIRLEREAKDKLFAIAERYHPSATETLTLKTEPRLSSESLLSRSTVLQSVLNILIRFGSSALWSRKTPFSAMLAWASTIFELLLANEASQDFEATDQDLEQAFFVAAEEGPSLLVGVLDDILHKRLAPGLMRESRSKALCLAASAGDLSAVDILLRRSVDINFKDDDGWTALQLASDAGHLKIVQRLCQQKADLDKRGSGQQTALTCAAGSNKSDASLILEVLLKRRADAKAKTKRRGNGINLAARLGNKRSVELLLAMGVNAEIRTVRDGTPLEVAAIRNYTDVVQILLKNLDAKEAQNYLQEAMQSAAIYGSFDTVKALLDENPNIQIKGKLLAKVVRSSWVSGGVVDILRKHQPSKDMQSRLRTLEKAARNWRHATFALPLQPYSGDIGPSSSVAACLLQHEDDKSLVVPEEIFIALAEKSDKATISLLMKKSRDLQITAMVLAAAAGNAFHGDTVLPFLLEACPSSFLDTLKPQQGTPIMKAAVGNRELGVSTLEIVHRWIPAHALRIEDCIFAEAAGNAFHGKALIERLLQLLILLPCQSRERLVVTPEIVQTAAQNWSSGDLVLQTLLESESTAFPHEAVVEVILGFTEAIKDMDLDRYEVDVLSLLLKRTDVIVTPDVMTLVMKRADRNTVEMFEKQLPTSIEITDIEIEQQIVAAASNMEHAPELVEYLLETRKGIILTERLLDIAAEKDEESEPNITEPTRDQRTLENAIRAHWNSYTGTRCSYSRSSFAKHIGKLTNRLNNIVCCGHASDVGARK
ncbi:ankyrin [Stipitochalara longipes BDJ]|nr:ankyrin [Stipitochalara longipes BDJ]